MPFPTPPGSEELLILLPELLLMGGGMLLLLLEMLWPRRTRLAGWLAVLIIAVALVAVYVPWGFGSRAAGGSLPFFALPDRALTAFHGSLVVDGFGLWAKIIVLVGSILSVLLGLRYAERFKNPGEFFSLMVFATSAAVLLCGAADLLMIYLSVEFLSITSYILVGYLKFQPRSTEAALKYFLYGAITAAVMLYGLSLLYGVAGSTALYQVEGEQRGTVIRAVSDLMARDSGAGTAVILVSIALVAVGFGFKTGMVPFHQWVPDVYDGSPLPVMAWLSVASKAAGMAVMVRVFYLAFDANLWVFPIAMMSALTMTWGNLAALGQQNIKRMLAYSSVAHAGYTLMALAALGAGRPGAAGVGEQSPWQIYGVITYLATYVFMNLGALAIVTAVYHQTKSHRIEDYAGLAQRSPGLAWLMVFFMLSLAGIPPTAGFWGKFVLFAGVIETHLIWLGIVAFVNSVISVYYYWGVVRAMFLMKPTTEQGVAPVFELRLTIGLAAAFTFLIFLFAGQFMAFLGAS